MNRQEFIASCAELSEQELLSIALESRNMAASRVPPEVQIKFRSLDGVTEAKELWEPTAFGKTHLFIVREKDLTGPLPVVVNVHGGGWSLDHTERDTYFCRRLAARLHCLVVDVDYVLAPEHPYPAALEEIEALLDCFPRLLETWNGDPSNIVFCGQSAGGNLAAAVLQRRRWASELGIKAQVLCYLPTDNYNDHFHGSELDARGKSTEYYGFFYNRVFDERKNSDVSILFASDEELRRLPPTDIVTAGLDNLCEEGKAYYDRLVAVGVAGEYRCFENSRHGFLVNLYDEWQEGEDYAVNRIHAYLQH